MAAGVKPRVHIIGGPGSGKSYLAAKLAEYFGVPAYDLDHLYWDQAALNYGTRADPEERNRQLARIVSGNGWIVEGVYYEWLAPGFMVADIIIALVPSMWIRHRRVIRRFILRRLGRIPAKHESLADLWHLLCWSQGYDANHLVQARQFIAGLGCKLVTCKTSDEVLALVRSRIT